MHIHNIQLKITLFSKLNTLKKALIKKSHYDVLLLLAYDYTHTL